MASLDAVGLRKDSGEVAVLDESQGLLQPCDWLDFGRVEAIPAAALAGSQLEVLVAPPGWSPGEAKFLREEDLARDYDFVVSEAGVETFRNRTTGGLVYVGRVLPRETNQ